MNKGDVVLSDSMVTQSGRITADAGHCLVSVFLGSSPIGVDPDPKGRMHSLGWRQMAMFECTVQIGSGDQLDVWRLPFSCLGVVDAVEAAVRFGNKLVSDKFKSDKPKTPAPYLASIAVATIEFGPISEDGEPFDGRHKPFFGWNSKSDVTLEEHMGELRKEARKVADDS